MSERLPSGARRWPLWLGGIGLVTLLTLVSPDGILAQEISRSYGDFPLIGSRAAVWIAAQVHLLFAAFVLGVPMFAVVAEAIGIFGKDRKYDKLAKEFTRLLLVAYSATAIWGAILSFLLVTLYPRLWVYLTQIFAPSMWAYAGLFFLESFTLYLYYYGWDRWAEGRAKLMHWGLGIMLNVFGTIVMFIANSWLTFMMSPPADVTPDTSPAMVQFWSAFANATWMPINIHRLIANVVFGGAIVGAYAAYRFLIAETDEERAHYDWMGYVGNLIAIGALIVLPFAGYYLGREIYAYSQQMGVSMMGGSFAQLWILQAILIGSLFLAINLYLWLAMGRIPGGERYRKFQAPVLFVLATGLAVWATPHTIIATFAEMKAMGSAHHPRLGVLGVMSAKNTAVNLMILATFITFMLYRRGNKEATSSFAATGNWIQVVTLLATIVGIVSIGIYGYFVPAAVRVGLSVYQPLMVGAFMILFLVLDVPISRGAKSLGEIRWGQMPRISQYVLFFLAATFTWLMGLMGYIRSGIRQHWHVYQVMKDTSEGAFIPSHAFATMVVSIIVIVFFLFVSMVFALAMRSELKERRSM
ncbi:MAG: cytochrome ubiquinol oxidase subunit I [Myxococcales bacterium]|nr:cytochrome ubiquinol oxidase subunit I [Myxococcales bacterium]